MLLLGIMRLPKHNLPKAVYKKERSVKHKDSNAKKIRKQTKLAKAEEMDIVTESITEPLNSVDQETAKLERKKANLHKIVYKKVKKIR